MSNTHSRRRRAAASVRACVCNQCERSRARIGLVHVRSFGRLAHVIFIDLVGMIHDGRRPGVVRECECCVRVRARRIRITVHN